MLSRQKIKITFRQQFLVFFLVSAILPLLVFSAIFLHKSDVLLTSSNSELLRTGIVLWEELVVDALDRLELNADSWNAQPERHPSMLLRLDANGKVLENRLPPQTDAPLFIRSILQETVSWRQELLAHRLAARKGLLALSGSRHGHRLMLVAAVVTHDKTGQANILILGRWLQSLLKSQELAQAPQDFSYRLVNLTPQGQPDAVISNTARMATAMPGLKRLKHASENRKWFLESIDGAEYGSLVHRLRDQKGRVRGYMIVSLSLQAMRDLDLENRLYIVFFLGVALFLLILLGARFNRLYIKPIQALTATSQQVASGDLSARISLANGDAAMMQTVHHFNRMLDQIQEKETIRKTFISTLSHDLRTPLIAQKRVLDYFQEYVRPTLDQQAVQLLDGMSHSTDNQMEMIRHLLETFQYESGKIHLRQKAVPLHLLVSQCCQTLQSVADSKQITLNNFVDSALLAWVDETQFRRVLYNLIGNSLQNIADGDRIEISAQGTLTSSDAQLQTDGLKNGVVLRVHDTGPGIEEDLLPQLFQRYPQAQGRQQQIGSGLGLFICKMIIEMHGGTIQVHSQPKNGTTFLITVPPQPESPVL
jgi:signal transduction histidine kinase